MSKLPDEQILSKLFPIRLSKMHTYHSEPAPQFKPKSILNSNFYIPALTMVDEWLVLAIFICPRFVRATGCTWTSGGFRSQERRTWKKRAVANSATNQDSGPKIGKGHKQTNLNPLAKSGGNSTSNAREKCGGILLVRAVAGVRLRMTP